MEQNQARSILENGARSEMAEPPQANIVQEIVVLRAVMKHHGLFQFIHMPFGLKNAPATFLHSTEGILSTVNGRFALVSPNDIEVIFEKPGGTYQTPETRPDATWWWSSNYYMKESERFSNIIIYLGQVIIPPQLALTKDKINEICDLKTLTNISKIRSFLDLCKRFLRFVPNCVRDSEQVNKVCWNISELPSRRFLKMSPLPNGQYKNS